MDADAIEIVGDDEPTDSEIEAMARLLLAVADETNARGHEI